MGSSSKIKFKHPFDHPRLTTQKRLRNQMDGSLRIPFDMFDMQEEDPYAALATSVRRGLETLLPLPHTRCIFQVPDRLRQLNGKAYTPRVISIGPLHMVSKFSSQWNSTKEGF
ncbi:hypothetical protein J1N35_032145 [Gossypium stocksii]|uniref:Uncharacterized protein n=1 Tax=Gossypium stocksii TaxID=47602 RepID=A0A9D3V2P8_9ROSI|nr:hypothetical protein J1N35_032145 [Gossypium stocksii]